MIEEIWKSEPKPWLTVFKNENYYYSQRLGKDSVGIVPVRRTEDGRFEILLHQEFNPAHNKVLEGAFGGSMDKDKSPLEIALLELRQESGYVIDETKLYNMGRMFSSTQSNEIIHLYIANVTGAKNVGRNLEDGEDPWDLQKNNWTEWENRILSDIEDPRFVTAITRFVFQNPSGFSTL
jgi:8-oxo-dGTP pyrophosphatase MutT (NUDIX family)